MIRQFFVEGQQENRKGPLSHAVFFDKAFVFTNFFRIQLSFSGARNKLKSAVGAIGA